MKKLVVCLSFLVFTFSASAADFITIEPMLLSALFDQAGTLKAKTNQIDKPEERLSDVLAAALGYTDPTSTHVVHRCEYVDPGFRCKLAVYSKYNDKDLPAEMSAIITYDSVHDLKSDTFIVKTVNVVYANRD